jgi:cytochrome c oxidase subunit 2
MSRRVRIAAAVAGVAAAPLLAGCSGPQSALDPRGPEAHALADLYWLFFWICAVIWVLVVVALVWALARRHEPRPDPLATNEKTEGRMRWVVGTLAVITGGIVISLAVLSYSAQAHLFGATGAPLTIKVTGHQWWWEVEYDDPNPSRTFTTANEIHVPVGQAVKVQLTSADVIHSFWVPSLMGKMDAITGRTNEVQFTAGVPGVYRGQCAEFCGFQHAHMAMVVFADPPDRFAAWRDAQIASAPPPATPSQQRGQVVFLSNPCVTCHAIRGIPAGGRAGPELTHLASRTTIAAGTLPMTRGALAGWITDPQGVKPGADMPPVALPPADLQALLDYLESLK